MSRTVSVDMLRSAIGFEDLIEPTAEAFKAATAGAGQHGMLVVHPDPAHPERGDIMVKVGVMPERGRFIVKVAPWLASGDGQPKGGGGHIAVFDLAGGAELAIIHDEHYLSDIRTAAAGALAARLLAPATVRTAFVVGTGTQAYWQARALCHERQVETLAIWGRDPTRAAALRERLLPALAGTAVVLTKDLPAAVQTADVVITATTSREPLIDGEWLHEGQHVTAVGADDPTKCELAPSVLARALVYVDARSAAGVNGNLVRAASDTVADGVAIAAEIGELLMADPPFRRDPRAITVATLVGLGIQDVVAVEVALNRLEELESRDGGTSADDGLSRRRGPSGTFAPPDFGAAVRSAARR